MGLILDTSVFIAIEQQLINFNSAKTDEKIYISSITVTELLVGVHMANTEVRKIKRGAFVEQIISSIGSLPFGNEEARIYTYIIHQLKSHGTSIGAHDLIIGATAIAHNCRILTMNESDFKRIPGLEIEPIAKYISSN